MPLYKFKVTNSQGQISVQSFEGENEKEARRRLRNQKLKPLQFLGEVSASQNKSTRSFDVCDFTARLDPLLTAHVPLEKSLGIISEGMEGQSGQDVVNNLRRGLHEGKKLSAMIRSQGSCFPDVYANLIEAGEEAGILHLVVAELRRYLESRREVSNFLITSIIYPSFIVAAVLVVIAVLIFWLIPKFAGIFASMKRPVPGLMKFLMDSSNFIMTFWWLWILLAIGAVITYSILIKKPETKLWIDKILLNTPILGSIIKSTETSRFIRTLSILLQNHVHLLNSVNIAIKSIQNKAISATLFNANRDLRSGMRLSNALHKSPFIEKATLQMIAIGEESGNTGEMLRQVADISEQQLKTKIKRLLALLEPMIIIVLAVVVLVVVIAIFQAIQSLNQF